MIIFLSLIFIYQTKETFTPFLLSFPPNIQAHKRKEFPFHFPILSLPLYFSFPSLLPSAAIHKVNVLFFVKVCLDFVIEGTQV